LLSFFLYKIYNVFLQLETKNFSPEDKGDAISNIPELALAHSKHAKPESNPLAESIEDKPPNGLSTNTTMEAFHFTCYLPLNGHLFELDGLKQSPIDHGPLPKDQPWHDMARSVVTERIKFANDGEKSHDIRYNLMAVIPCPIDEYRERLSELKLIMQMLLNNLTNENLLSKFDGSDAEKLRDDIKNFKVFIQSCATLSPLNEGGSSAVSTSSVKNVSSYNVVNDFKSNENSKLSYDDVCIRLQLILNENKLLKTLKEEEDINNSEEGQTSSNSLIWEVVDVTKKIKRDIEKHQELLREECEKMEKYKIDDERRTHDYIDFISLFLSMMQEQNLLGSLLEQNSVNRKRPKKKIEKKRRKLPKR